MKIKIALQGAGGISWRVANGIKHSENCELVLLTSRDLNKASKLAEEFNVSKFSDNYEDLYQADIDAIYITTITKMHYQQIKTALNHGKHVICEKPMIISQEELVELYQLASSKGLFLLEAMKCRYLPTIKRVKDYLAYYPYPKNILITFCRNEHINSEHWVNDPIYGNAIVDIGSYALSFALELFSDILSDVKLNLVLDNGIIKTAWIMAKNTKGLTLTLGCSQVFDLANHATISGDDYQIVVSDYWKTMDIALYENKKLIESIKTDFISEFSYQLDYFAEVITSNKIVKANQEQLEFLLKIIAIYEMATSK